MNGKFAHKKQAEARDNTGARSIAHGRRASDGICFFDEKATGFIRAGLLSFELATSQQLHLEPNTYVIALAASQVRRVHFSITRALGC